MSWDKYPSKLSTECRIASFFVFIPLKSVSITITRFSFWKSQSSNRTYLLASKLLRSPHSSKPATLLFIQIWSSRTTGDIQGQLHQGGKRIFFACFSRFLCDTYVRISLFRASSRALTKSVARTTVATLCLFNGPSSSSICSCILSTQWVSMHNISHAERSNAQQSLNSRKADRECRTVLQYQFHGASLNVTYPYRRLQ